MREYTRKEDAVDVGMKEQLIDQEDPALDMKDDDEETKDASDNDRMPTLDRRHLERVQKNQEYNLLPNWTNFVVSQTKQRISQEPWLLSR